MEYERDLKRRLRYNTRNDFLHKSFSLHHKHFDDSQAVVLHRAVEPILIWITESGPDNEFGAEILVQLLTLSLAQAKNAIVQGYAENSFTLDELAILIIGIMPCEPFRMSPIYLINNALQHKEKEQTTPFQKVI